MPDTFASHELLFATIQAVWSGDTGKLGGNVASQGVVARVQDLFRYQVGYDKPPIPSIAVEITGGSDDNFLVDHEELAVRFHVYTEKDRAHGDQNAIVQQIRMKYQRNASLTGGDNWLFGTMFIGRGDQQPRTADYNHFIQTAQVGATRNP